MVSISIKNEQCRALLRDICPVFKAVSILLQHGIIVQFRSTPTWLSMFYIRFPIINIAAAALKAIKLLFRFSMI